MKHLSTVVLIVVCTAGVQGDGEYWWMNSNAFTKNQARNGKNQKDHQHSSGRSGYQQNIPGNSFQKNSGNSFQGTQGNVLPATQGLTVLPKQGSCPAVTNIPPVEQCAGRASNCWSAGEPDVDCIDNALCCFDGCANVCQGAGSISPAQPPNPRQPVQPRPVQPKQRPTPRPAQPTRRPAQPTRRPAQPTRRPVQPKSKPKQHKAKPAQQRPKPNRKPANQNRVNPQKQTRPAQTQQRRPVQQQTRPVLPSRNTPQQGSCPAASNPLSPQQCQGRVSNCWSVGQPDVDCIDNALCCFDGCANVCQGAGSISAVQPPARQPQQFRPNPSQNQNKIVQQQTATGQQSRPVQQPSKPVQPSRPVQQPSRPVQQPSRPVQQPSRPVQQPSRPVQQQANQKPYASCPSAMKCVQREYCDFAGVMTNDIIESTPVFDMLRVPLIPCVNRQRGNSIDVCCRDPNYQDPWPDMNGTGMKKMNGKNLNTGNNFQGRGNQNNPGQAGQNNGNHAGYGK